MAATAAGTGAAAPDAAGDVERLDRAMVEASIRQLAEMRQRVEGQAAAIDGDLARVATGAAARLAGMKPGERAVFAREMRLLKAADLLGLTWDQLLGLVSAAVASTATAEALWAYLPLVAGTVLMWLPPSTRYLHQRVLRGNGAAL